MRRIRAIAWLVFTLLAWTAVLAVHAAQEQAPAANDREQAPPAAEPVLDKPPQDKPAQDEPDGEKPAKDNAAHDNAAPRKAVLIHMTGTITPIMEKYMERALSKAEKQQAKVVIVQIDSPGGFVFSSLELAKRFHETKSAMVVAYIPRRALSGAAIASLGCEKILMHPTAHFGDAGEIFMDENGQFRYVPEKERSHLATEIRTYADLHDRPATIVEAMVDKDLQVFEFRNKKTGAKQYQSDLRIASLADANDWEKVRPVPESGPGRFLEVTGERAVELGLAEATVENQQQLEKLLNIETPRVIKPGAVDSVVFWLNLPLITGLLFVIGLVALYIEFSAPGMGFGGVVAGICFAVFFWSRFLGGTAGWLEVIMFVGGIVLLGFELFVIPGFGFFGLTGILLICISLILASQEFFIPQTQPEVEHTAVSLMVLVGSGFLFMGAAVFLARHFGRLPILNRLALETPVADVHDDQTVAKPTSSYASANYHVGVGDWGVADSPLRPAGKAIFGEDYVDVVADGTFVDSGRPVRVVKISGNRIVVREVEEKPVA